MPRYHSKLDHIREYQEKLVDKMRRLYDDYGSIHEGFGKMNTLSPLCGNQ
jgi:hypothetical protein